MNPSLTHRIDLLKLALAYVTYSLKIRDALTVATERGAFDQITEVTVNPAKITDAEKKFAETVIPKGILEQIIAAPDTEAVTPSKEMFFYTLLKCEIDDGPVQRDLLQLAVEDQKITDEQLAALAKDLDTNVFRQIIRLLDSDENHQTVYDQAMIALAQVLYRTPKISGAFDDVFALRKEQNKIVFDAAPTLLRAAPRDDDQPRDPGGSHKPNDPSQQKVPSMSDQNEVADAISRLQDTFSTGLATMSSSGSRSFDTVLSEQQYNTLSIPALDSEAALAMGEAKLADKIFRNLSQAVRTDPGVETTVYTFNPKQVRTLEYSGSGARGGAAIIAKEVETIRPAFLDRMRALEPEECTCDDHQASELINEAEDILISIANEVGAETGPFTARVFTMINRLTDTITETMVLNGIRLEGLDKKMIVSKTTAEFYGKSVQRAKSDFAPASSPSPRIEVGLLVEDANDEAVKSLFNMIDRLVVLLLDPDGSQTGATFSRLLNRLDAIPPSVGDLRNALRRAGVSLVDQKASFISDGKTTMYELDRLLSWIDEDVGKYHADLMDGSATKRELRWLRQSLGDMLQGLKVFDEEDGASTPYAAATPKNAYAAVRRQIRELMGLIDSATVDANNLVALCR